jgi:hypothetical protein
MEEARWRQWDFIPITDIKAESDQTNGSAQLGLWLKESEFDLFNQMLYKNFIQAVR